MRFHPRRPLPQKALQALSQWQSALDKQWAEELGRPEESRRSPSAVADLHWDNHRSTKAVEVVVKVLKAMASPRMERCMYCEHDRGKQIDHSEPKSSSLRQTFVWDNYVWACPTCNHEKSTRYHDEIVNPTTHDPLDFLVLASDGKWEPTEDGGRGAVTVETLPLLNDDLLAKGRDVGRRHVIAELKKLAENSSATEAEVDEFRETMITAPFSDVFAAVLAAMQQPGAESIFPPVVVSFVQNHHDIHHWLAEADNQRWHDAQEEIAALTAQIRLRRNDDPEDA